MLRNRFGRMLRSVVGVWASWAAVACVASAVCATEKTVASAPSRLELLEFAQRGDANCDRAEPLLDAMRAKNYPIRRIERDAENAELFKRYSIETVPTFALVVDGTEIDRLAAQGESDGVLRGQLLRLFQRGRDELAAKSAEKRSSDAVSARPELVRGQQSSAAAPDGSAFGGFANYSIEAPDEPARNVRPDVANVASATVPSEIDAATVRVAVDANVGSGTIVHVNETCGEALAVVAATLFDGQTSGDAAISVEVADAATGRTTTVSGVDVLRDPTANVAFVAFSALTGLIVRPAPFLPPTESLRVGEVATSAVRASNGTTQTFQRKVLTPEGDRVSGAPENERRGAGLFVERAGRFYLAGVCVSGDAARGEGTVATLASVAKALQTRENLAVVYRDQLAGKFDVAAKSAAERPAAPAPSAASDSEIAASFRSFGSLDSFDAAETSKNVRAGRADVEARRIRSTNYEPKASAANPVASAVAQEENRVAAQNFDAQGGAVSTAGAADSDELFEASLDALRRRRSEGAEIICVVNWNDDPNSATRRESEVLRLPTRAETAATLAPNADANVSRGVVRASSIFPETSLLR